MTVVTIRGQLGSGAPEIGKLIARKINADYVDREIIAKVAEQLNQTHNSVEEKEMPAGTFLGRLEEILNHYPPVLSSNNPGTSIFLSPLEIPIDDPSYFSGLQSVIKELANEPHIVICGRGSQFILKDHPYAFHVLTVSPLDMRIKHVIEEYQLSEDEAKKKIISHDSSRHEFIKRYFKAELEDPVNYDLVVNTAHLNFQAAASIIVEAISLKR